MLVRTLTAYYGLLTTDYCLLLTSVRINPADATNSLQVILEFSPYATEAALLDVFAGSQ